MKNGKVLFLLLCLILVVGMIGCSSGGSSSGGSTPAPTPQTPTQKLVGNWNFVSSTDGLSLGRLLVFNANGTGDAGGSGFSGWRIDGGVLYFVLDSGADEAFTLTWNSDNNITLTNHNGGASYTYSRAS